MRGECGARPEYLEGSPWPVCTRQKDGHRALDHRAADGYQWPACSQHCLINHVHGAYRLHLGGALGPGTLEGRAPGRGRAARGKRARCRICLEPRELKDGICADRAACVARMAPLFDLGEEQ